MTIPPEPPIPPSQQRRPLDNMVLVEYCLDCHHLAQINYADGLAYAKSREGEAYEVRIVHIWHEGLGGDAHVSNVPYPATRCEGRWGIASAYVLNDDDSTGDLDVVIPAIGRWYRKEWNLTVYEDK